MGFLFFRFMMDWSLGLGLIISTLKEGKFLKICFSAVFNQRAQIIFIERSNTHAELNFVMLIHSV